MVAVTILLLVILSTVSNASEIIDVQIKGIDDGVRTTKQQDYKEAVLFAKREAIERAGVKIESTTKVKDLILYEDYIESRAEAVLLPGYNIIDVGYAEDGTYHVVLVGKIAVEKPFTPGEPKVPMEGASKPGVEERPAEPQEKTLTNSLGMKFVYIPPGTFVMGSPPDEPQREFDETQHKVTLSKGFFMQTTEVTQGQWREIMGENLSHFRKCGDECPAEMVTWDEARQFVRLLNRREETDKYRLPTEAEWEYACRAGTTTAFSFGRCLDTEQANYAGFPLPGCAKGEFRESTMPVGSFPPNAFGLYDMHGNVCEWCEDWYGYYAEEDVRDPKGPPMGDLRVVRGGGWDCTAQFCRSADRRKGSPMATDRRQGFRVAKTP
jgi:formylglycine-generating enzyme required for sulfatase activity